MISPGVLVTAYFAAFIALSRRVASCFSSMSLYSYSQTLIAIFDDERTSLRVFDSGNGKCEGSASSGTTDCVSGSFGFAGSESSSPLHAASNNSTTNVDRITIDLSQQRQRAGDRVDLVGPGRADRTARLRRDSVKLGRARVDDQRDRHPGCARFLDDCVERGFRIDADAHFREASAEPCGEGRPRVEREVRARFVESAGIEQHL